MLLKREKLTFRVSAVVGGSFPGVGWSFRRRISSILSCRITFKLSPYLVFLLDFVVGCILGRLRVDLSSCLACRGVEGGCGRGGKDNSYARWNSRESPAITLNFF